jgi:hypothetical protein
MRKHGGKLRDSTHDDIPVGTAVAAAVAVG